MASTASTAIDSTVEKRLARLEQEVATLKRQAAGASAADWLSRVAGSFEDEPEFDQVLRLGREIRQSDRPEGADEPMPG